MQSSILCENSETRFWFASECVRAINYELLPHETFHRKINLLLVHSALLFLNSSQGLRLKFKKLLVYPSQSTSLFKVITKTRRDLVQALNQSVTEEILRSL